MRIERYGKVKLKRTLTIVNINAICVHCAFKIQGPVVYIEVLL